MAFKFYVPFVARWQSGPLEYDMRFLRDTEAGLQEVVRDESEFWIELGPDVRASSCVVGFGHVTADASLVLQGLP